MPKRQLGHPMRAVPPQPQFMRRLTTLAPWGANPNDLAPTHDQGATRVPHAQVTIHTAGNPRNEIDPSQSLSDKPFDHAMYTRCARANNWRDAQALGAPSEGNGELSPLGRKRHQNFTDRFWDSRKGVAIEACEMSVRWIVSTTKHTTSIQCCEWPDHCDSLTSGSCPTP
jgi:hypothetical protein